MIRTGIDLSVDGRWRERVTLVQYFWRVEILKNGHYTSSIPIVGYTTAIVDVTGCILQNLFARAQKRETGKWTYS